VERLLLAAPRLALLVTSREPLQADLETVQPIAPLSVPKASTPGSVDEIMGYSAVQLLVSRARARQHDFNLREQDLPIVGDICRRLDGLPLAIELAAAQIDALALVGLQTQLDNGLRLLRHGRRTAVPRLQSMSAALDWSYQDLRASEQRVLQRLSVFKMAFTEEAALRVLDGAHLTAIIERLAAKSWLMVERGSDPLRYRMLNTIRCYVREQLQTSGELSAIVQHHALYQGANRSRAGVQLAAQRVEQ
jgi:predicted ATPase